MTLDNNMKEEQSLLGTIFLNADILDEMPNLRPEHFEDDINKQIFQEILNEKEFGKEITALNVVKALGKKEEVVQYVSSLCGMCVSKKLAISYSKNVIEEGIKRNTINSLKEIIERSEEPNFNVGEAISKIEVEDISDERDFQKEALETLQWKMAHKNESSGIRSGVSSFDEMINGFNNGCLYICAGRSSMGKSAFMTSAISNIEKLNTVGIVSLEMTGKELVNRICSIRSKTPYWVIDRGLANDNQFDRFAEEVMNLKNIHIDDRGGLNCYQVCAKIRQMVRRCGCKIVFVDHVGLIKVDEKGNLAHAIGNITAALKSLAKELKIPIVVLCQVSRGVEKNGVQSSKKPHLSDLRDSGRIEEDADCVFFLYRENYYNNFSKEEKIRYEQADIIVAKNRNGATGEIKCNFDNQLMFFYK